MSAIVLDGRSLAAKIESKLALELRKLQTNVPQEICLATILVGNDKSSAIYVDMKINACRRIGLQSQKILLPEATTTNELLAVIATLNKQQNVYGILLQHPVPPHIDERLCFDAIAAEKDVDGVTSLGFGRMSMGQDAYGSATPVAIMTLLKHYKIALSGKKAVVVGRSPILGKPLAMMLLQANATVTICHSHTQNLENIISQAEILVGACGQAEFIKSAWVKDNSVVVDAGYHPHKVGDIELSDSLKARSLAYTPVPGGVGPMTIVMLMQQTIAACKSRYPSLIK